MTLSAPLAAALRFNADGLIPAIAQQHDTGEVLMMAWMSAASIAETLETGHACYFSRSRQQLWRKGETSGHTQRLIELRLDCDGDTLLVLVDQTGAACHTGTRSCFYRRISNGVIANQRADANQVERRLTAHRLRQLD